MSSEEKLQVRIQKEIAELTSSISGVVSSFRKLQRPLVETREKVPQATNQLDKIAEQTEAVATRMLDVVEQMTQREDEVIQGIEEIRQAAEAGKNDAIERMARDLAAKASDNLNDAYQIMESLQFQDIQAQQMDHAASLLEDVEGKLHSVLKAMGATDTTALLGTINETARRVRAYDPHADLVDKKTDQEDIDSLFAQKK